MFDPEVGIGDKTGNSASIEEAIGLVGVTSGAVLSSMR